MTTSGRVAKGLLVTSVAAAIGIGFAWLAGKDGITAFGYPVFVICAALALAVNWIAFVPAAIARTEKYYDLMGSFTFLSIIALVCLLSQPLDVRAVVAAAMVTVWTSRLGLFLFRRIGAAGGVDGRFDAIKTNPPRFLVTWTLQAVWAIVTASAAIVIISTRDRVPLDPFFWAGAAIWTGAFAVEVIADRQKAVFRADSANRGRFITTGLWSWSQHPNYFGEIMMWTGMAIMAVPLLSGWSYIVFLSPLLIFLLLTRVSGINLLDAAGQAKWGDDPDYRAYRARTSVLIPRPPAPNPPA